MPTSSSRKPLRGPISVGVCVFCAHFQSIYPESTLIIPLSFGCVARCSIIRSLHCYSTLSCAPDIPFIRASDTLCTVHPYVPRP